MYNYGIGGMDAKGDESEAFADIPQNRTLLIEKFTDNDPLKPEMVTGLQTINDVFANFKPEKEVEFMNEHGETNMETLHFAELSDFGTKGIINQSSFLQGLQNQKDQYDKLVKQIKTNKTLMNVLNDAELRKQYLNALKALIQEMEDAK